jgi:hypothetical protein
VNVAPDCDAVAANEHQRISFADVVAAVDPVVGVVVDALLFAEELFWS